MAAEEEEVLELDDDEDDELDDDDEDPEEALSEEDAADSASLEELLAQRAAARRVGEDPEEDVTELMSMSDREPTDTVEPAPSKIAPIKETAEFVCSNCYLVKPRVQMADGERRLCRDCV